MIASLYVPLFTDLGIYGGLLLGLLMLPLLLPFSLLARTEPGRLLGVALAVLGARLRGAEAAQERRVRAGGDRRRRTVLAGAKRRLMMMRSTRYLIIVGEGMGEQRIERLEKAKAMAVVNEALADGQRATLCKIVSEIVGVFEPKAVKP